MQTPWMPRVDPDGMVRQAHTCAQVSASQDICQVSQLVVQAHLGEASSARSTGTRAFLPGLFGPGPPNQGHGGRPRDTTPWRLGAVCQSSQSPKPLQIPPRPKNSTRAGTKSPLIFAGSYVRTSVCVPAHGRTQQSARPRRLCRDPPPTLRKFRERVSRPRCSLGCVKKSPMGKRKEVPRCRPMQNPWKTRPST